MRTRGSQTLAILLSAATAMALALGATAAGAADDQIHKAIAKMADANGNSVGTVTLSEPSGAQGVIIDAILINLPPGQHAIHIHETGKCDPPDFKTAGGHYNPTNKKHGIKNPEGMHAGDLPNLYVPKSGDVHVEMFDLNLQLDKQLFDKDGASVIIHSGPDDYQTDPAGDAGARIACGVIMPQ